MIVIQIIGVIAGWLVLATLMSSLIMGVPIPAFSAANHPASYLITKRNKIDVQERFECAAYAAAYLMRHHGILAEGEELYNGIPSKSHYPHGECGSAEV